MQMIKVEDVSMKFNLASEKIDNVKEYLIRKVKGNITYDNIWALRDVNFAMEAGESVALVGLNGSGKSTFLKILAGVLEPTAGRVEVKGTIAPLIELGAGFDIDLTAKENIWLNGAIMGHRRSVMREHYEDIVEFSGLGKFMDIPVKNYSSGMLARLAFSVMTFGTPDLLIVDEVLSVGDFVFQEKCRKRIADMRERGTAILFVSHSIEQVREICTRAVWLERGRVRADGDCLSVTERYMTEGERAGGESILHSGV